MSRLLTLLTLLALIFANSAAVASVLCQHGDAQAHAAALQSDDAAAASEARSEDRAERTISDLASLADAAAASLAGYALPPEPISVPLRLRALEHDQPGDAAPLSGRSISPMLEPPLV
ncbi:hypothetical protein ETR14_01320 [Sphingosinicella sp. BN140058]|nr:hypothetical protein ETR14_01320 [Sphingosinicella sp. BN140058]